MAFDINELFKALTPEQVEQSMYNLLIAAGVDVTAWQSGSLLRTIINVAANMFAGFTDVLAAAIRGGFLDFAEGDYLTALAKYFYAVNRIEAVEATGTVTLTNIGGGLFPKGVGSVVFRNEITNKEYTNTAAFTLNPGSISTPTVLNVTIAASETGTESNANPGEIIVLVTPMTGVSVTNASPVLGIDEQSDADLRQACRDSIAAISPNGARDAYNYFAKNTNRPDGSPVGVTRTQVTSESSTGEVDVWLADNDGPIDPADVTYVNDNIQMNCVPLGITCTVQNAVAQPITISANISAQALPGITVGSLQTEILNSISEYFANYPIGGITKNGLNYFFYRDTIEKAIYAANDAIFDLTVNQPIGGDQTMFPGRVATINGVPVLNITLY